VKRAEELSSKDRKLRGVFKGNIKKAGAPKQIGLKTLFKRVKARTLLKEAEEQLAEELEEDKKEAIFKKVVGRPKLNPKPRKIKAPNKSVKRAAGDPKKAKKKQKTLFSCWKKN